MMIRIIALFCFSVWCAAASAQTIKSVPHRADSQAYAVLEPEQKPRAAVLLYVGGEGTLNLDSGEISSVNVVYRMRELLLKAGFRLIYADRPAGRHDRADADYARAAATIIERERSNSASALRTFAGDLKRAPATIVVLDGGVDEAPGKGRPAACHPLSYHGFNGIHDKVAETIIAWIEQRLAAPSR